MAKSVIEVDWEVLEKIRPLALKNGIKPTVQNLVDLSVKVTAEIAEMYGSLDTEDFENVCKLKK
jgi:ABC-type enterochelin transport system substrate-binding protein